MTDPKCKCGLTEQGHARRPGLAHAFTPDVQPFNISEQALEMARGTWRIGKQENVRAIAAALQKLIDRITELEETLIETQHELARAQRGHNV